MTTNVFITYITVFFHTICTYRIITWKTMEYFSIFNRSKMQFTVEFSFDELWINELKSMMMNSVIFMSFIFHGLFILLRVGSAASLFRKQKQQWHLYSLKILEAQFPSFGRPPRSFLHLNMSRDGSASMQKRYDWIKATILLVFKMASVRHRHFYLAQKNTKSFEFISACSKRSTDC